MNELIPCDLCGILVQKHLYPIHIIICGILQNRLFQPIFREFYDIPSPENHSEDIDCPICYDTIFKNKKCVKLKCGHIFCIKCIICWWDVQDPIKNCPYCRTELTKYIT